jgi:hypothetical protein
VADFFGLDVKTISKNKDFAARRDETIAQFRAASLHRKRQPKK